MKANQDLPVGALYQDLAIAPKAASVVLSWFPTDVSCAVHPPRKVSRVYGRFHSTHVRCTAAGEDRVSTF